MQLTHFSAEDADSDILQAIEEDGACIFDGLIDETLCDRLMAGFRSHIDAAPWCNTEPGNDMEGEKFFGRRTKRFHALISLTPAAAEVVAHPRLLALASAFHDRGNACRELRVSTTELMVLGGGEDRQMLHRDADSWIYLPSESRSRLLFSANVALCDFTERNGATLVVPGSHRWPPNRMAREDELCLATMRRGSALIYRGDVLHGGGNNTEAEIRTGFYVGFIPSWLATLENHAVSNDPDVLARLEEPVRGLLNVSEAFRTFP